MKFKLPKPRCSGARTCVALLTASFCAGGIGTGIVEAAESAATTRPAEDPLVIPLPPPLPTVPTTDGANPRPAESPGPATRPVTLPTSEPVEQTGTPDDANSTAMIPPTQPAQTQPNSAGQNQQFNRLITADLDRNREQIAPSLGAVTYTIGANQIQSIPGGENASFQQVLLRAPGVVEDSFGQEHVRGEHANLTYRVNGIILPTSIGSLGGFGQELDTRIISSVTLIDGPLPAQFGFRTAGVVDVTTKTGATLQNNAVSVYGGSYNTINPSLQFGGTSGACDYFVVGSFRHSGQGIENPSSDASPLHDITNQERLFAYLGYRIDDTSRVTLLLNGSYGTFQIPNRRGLTPSFVVSGFPTVDSAAINENQSELDDYAVISYQKTADRLSFQVSAFNRYGQIHFTPDPVADLQYQGVASEITNGFITSGMQFDASYVLDDHNTLRFGFLGDYTAESLTSSASVFPVDATGAQSSTVPFTLNDNHGNWGAEFGLYVQNEWKISDQWTLNYGARYDIFDASFDNEGQISPRVNLVWKIDKATTAHAGYARYFVPPPVQYVYSAAINRFAGTTNAPEVFTNDPLRAERSNYYDIGVTRTMSPAWEVTADAFYKGAKPLLDSGQFGSAIILAPFNYEVGRDYGAEFSTTIKQGNISYFGNFAWVSATGRNITSSQYLIGADELRYIRSHFIHLDHESEFTVSTGVTYTWKQNRVYVDLLYGSGLRAGFANTGKEPQYYPVNVGFEHIFLPGQGDGWKDIRFRFDVVNVFDQTYQLRNGTGIGVGAPQFGSRRGFYAGLTVDF